MFGGERETDRIKHRRARPPGKAGVRRVVSAAFLAVCCVLLSGCGGEPRLVPPAGQPPSPVNGPPAASTPIRNSAAPATAIGEIVWASATDPATNAPIEQASTYPPDAPRIIASASTSGLPTGTSIEATWDYNDTSLDAFTTQLVTTGRADKSWIGFYIERDPQAPWPAGVYEVAISLNGTVVHRAAIQVTEES